ncbi:DUF2798 domain-containing protein [Sedimentitalea arenosa]|jgi:hypothetical protein
MRRATRPEIAMVPARFAPVLFGFILSGLMSCMVSGISTLRAVGLTEGVLGEWMSSWALSWAIAFPVVLVVAPITRRLVALLVKSPG